MLPPKSMTVTSTTISLDNLKFYAYHGVLPQETAVGTYYTVSVRLTFTAGRGAMEQDKLEETINYAEVYDDIKSIMQIPHKLLESVAYDIAKVLLDHHACIQEAWIRVSKDTPPIRGVQCGGMAFEINVRQ